MFCVSFTNRVAFWLCFLLVLFVEVFSDNTENKEILNFANIQEAKTLQLSLKDSALKKAATSDILIDNINVVKAESTMIINITDIDKFFYFIVTEVHAHLHNVTLGYKPNREPHSYVEGRNVGLVNMTDGVKDVILYLENNNTVNVTVMINVIGYNKYAPIPGGCNMEFEVPVAPYLKLIEEEVMITVESQPASETQTVTTKVCSHPLQYEIYHLFMPERDFTVHTYFDSIRQMLTVAEIRKNGRKVEPPLLGSVMKKSYSAYTGIGSVYVLIVSDSYNGQAAYVPTQSYACNPEDNESCETFSALSTDMMYCTMFITGIFLCLFGHRYFELEMFIFGTLVGTIGTSIYYSRYPDLFPGWFYTYIFGLQAGATWYSLWTYIGIPIFSVLLPILCFGFLITSFVLDCFCELQIIQEVNANYWSALLCGTMLITFVLLLHPRLASVLSCVYIGSYLAVLPVDFYLGSSLRYVVVNSLRRASVPEFDSAAVSRPYQLNDFFMYVLWIAVLIGGAMYQKSFLIGKPPFPPTPLSLITNWPNRITGGEPTERTPLNRQRNLARVAVTPGSDNVFYN